MYESNNPEVILIDFYIRSHTRDARLAFSGDRVRRCRLAARLRRACAVWIRGRVSDLRLLISLRALRVCRFCSRYPVYSDRVSRVPSRVIEWGLLSFSVGCISFRFAVAAVTGCMRGARVAPAYLYIPAVLCDVSVFMASITLGDVAFPRAKRHIAASSQPTCMNYCLSFQLRKSFRTFEVHYVSYPGCLLVCSLSIYHGQIN